MSKTKQSFQDWLNQVRFVMKTRQDNDVTNCIGLVYAETNTQLSESSRLGAVYAERKLSCCDW